MIVNESLNAVAWYTLEVTSIDKGKMKIIINRLKLDITKDVLMRDNLTKLYSKALSVTQRLKTLKLRMTNEMDTFEWPRWVALTLRPNQVIIDDN